MENILEIALLKNLCQNEDVKRVLINSQTCKLYLYKKDEIMSERLAKLIEENKDVAVLKFEDVPIIELDLHLSPLDKVKWLINILKN